MRFVLTLVMTVQFAAALPAQIPTLFIDDAIGPPQSEPAVGVHLSNTNTYLVSGLSLGVCHNSTDLTALSVNPSPQLLNLNNGSPPDFYTAEVLPDGVTMGTILSFISAAIFPVGNIPLITIDYVIEMPVGNSTTLSFCDTLGVETILAVQNTIPVVPTLLSGTVTSDITGPLFEFSTPDATIDFNPSNGIEAFAVGATIEELPGSPGGPNAVHGFSMALSHDSTLLASLGASLGPPLGALNAGAGPDFFGVTILSDGITVGTVFSCNDPTQVLGFPTGTTVVTFDYVTLASALLGQLSPVTTELDWENGLGQPPIANTVVYSSAGDTTLASFDNAFLVLNPVAELFVRGDCTGNGFYDIGDPVGLLGFMFGGGLFLPCEDVCDANDDGTLDLSDAIYLLSSLFVGGPHPPAPYPDCNADPTPDSLDCGNFPGCP